MKTLKRELALVRVVAAESKQDQALEIAGRWSGRLLELSQEQFIVELAGSPQHLTEFLEEIRYFGEISVTRSGALTFSSL